jgi:hypothetical protein
MHIHALTAPWRLFCRLSLALKFRRQLRYPWNVAWAKSERQA